MKMCAMERGAFYTAINKPMDATIGMHLLDADAQRSRSLCEGQET